MRTLVAHGAATPVNGVLEWAVGLDTHASDVPRLFLEAPKLTGDAFALLKLYCQESQNKKCVGPDLPTAAVPNRTDANSLRPVAPRRCALASIALGISTLQALVDERPAARAIAVQMLLDFCVSTGARVRRASLAQGTTC